MKNDILDQAVATVQDQNPDPAAIDAAIRRVGDAITSPAASSPGDDTPLVLRGCADIQALVPAFVASRLSPARALLVEDHTRSCVRCRRALKAARSGPPASMPAAVETGSARRRPVAALALAAALLLCAALGTLWFVRRSAASGPVAHVDVVDGLLLAPAAGTRIAVGAGLAGGEAVRTGRSGGTVLVLTDGSRVELAERSQVSIARGFGGTTVALARGRVIVRAAKQRGGHLYVKTSDCLVSVTGTVFSVAQGARGSRVSVLEGEVHVDDGRAEKVLHRGDQASTNGAVAKTSLEEEFGWSRDRVALLELAGEIARVQKQLAAAPAAWSGRTSTRLLDAMPDGTVVFAAVPNVSGTVADFYDALAPRLASNPVLASWWGEGPNAPERQAEVKRLLDALRTWGSYLGEEVALGIGTKASGDPGAPIVLTTVARPGFRAFLESELARGDATTRVRIVESASEATAASAAGGDALFLWLRDDLVAAAFDGATLARLETSLASPGAFRGGTFHARLADAYRDGVDLLVGVDLKAFVENAASASDGDAGAGETLRMSGLLDAEHLIVERRSSAGASTGRATLTFSAERHGLAGWLAAPAPMGSLSFVSSGAAGALAFVMKEPALLVDDLFATLSAGQPDFPAKLAAFETEHGFRVKADLAEALGGDIAVAIDGPLLPTPAWKIVVEVYDAPRLQATIERLVSLADASARREGKPGVRLVSEASGRLTVHAIVRGDGSAPLQYAFVDGYLVAAPQKELVLRAAEAHATGNTLLTAPKLAALLPKDGPLDFSMLAFQDVGGLLGSLARSLGVTNGSAASGLSSSGASLAWAWAEPSRVVFGSAGSGPSDLASLVASAAVFQQPATRGK
jgi:ferric-dicitrate binding protein FerR (iron transport regulator)